MGFDIERFLEPVDDELKCGICFGVLEDPLVTTCGHVYCSQCLVQWIAENGTCPLTCEQLAIDDLKKIGPLTHLVSKLNIRCGYYQRGCQAILKIENLQAHQHKCQYVKDSTSGGKIMEHCDSSDQSVQVVVCEKGCGLPLLYQEPSGHDCTQALQTNIASLQVKITKLEHEKEQISERLAVREESLHERILNLENELHSYQIQALNFERQLKEYRSQVGYYQKHLEIRGEQPVESMQVEVLLERIDGSLGFNIMGGNEVGSKSVGGSGIVVSKIAEGGPAAKTGGLRVHDRIMKVNDIDLSEATHGQAVQAFKEATEPIVIAIQRKVDRNIECLNKVVSSGTQTETLSHDVDTDSGIHDRYSPRQDLLQLQRSKSLDDGTSSSEYSQRIIDSSRDDLELPNFRGGAFPFTNDVSPKGTMRSQDDSVLQVPVMKDINSMTDDNPNYMYNSYAMSDQVFFDEELDYEYEEVTLWLGVGDIDLGLTFCCGEEDESAVYICVIEQDSVAYLDGRLMLWDQVLKIDEQPVTHINDIEPLVCESSETIKFLVARPAQEVQATFIGAEGNATWECADSYGGFRIAAIKEEEEDGTETVNSEKTSGDKCEKDSGFGRTDESTKNDESSEQDTIDKTKRSKDKSNRKTRDNSNEQNVELSTPPTTPKKESKSRGKSSENGSSSSSKTVEKETSKRSPERSDKKRSNGSPTHKDKRSDRKKDKDKGTNERERERERERDREKDREKDRDKDRDRDKGRDRDRDRGKHSDHRRSRRLGCVDRSIRASYMRACKDSIQTINLFGIDDSISSKGDQRRRKSSKEESSNEAQQNEWKVRMTKDGKHIFVRKQSSTAARQARNKLLRDRAQKITEERRGLTTEDETQSVYLGRYCPRDMRRRQLEKVRQARIQRSQKLKAASDSPHTGSGSESGVGKRDLIVELSKRKMLKSNERSFDDFVTVQELLVQRNIDGCQSGPIHVTTV